MAVLLSVPAALSAQEVELTSPERGLSVRGTLLGFDGTFYRLRTVYGELSVDGTRVICDGSACPDPATYTAELRISGAPAMATLLLPALIDAFAQREGFAVVRDETGIVLSRTDRAAPVARFAISANSTDEGFADLLANEADIVLARREITDAEKTRAEEAGMGDLTGPNRSRVLALDAIVAVVAPGSPVDGIAPDVLARVFAGEDVSDLPGLGQRHLPFMASGLGQTIDDRLMVPADLGFAPDAVRHVDPDVLSDAVAADPAAIGLTMFSRRGNTRALTLTGTCGFSLDASRATIKTEDYPLTAPLFLYTPARRFPDVIRDFLAFTRTPTAQNVIRRAGFIDQTPEEIPVGRQGDRFANAIAAAGPEVSLNDLKRMVGRLGQMSRLTTSFRFEAGSSRLDPQSQSNVQQLARTLDQGQYNARRMLFVGFSDGDGPASSNLQTARDRAEIVMRAVRSATLSADLDRVDMDVAAFGEAMPMACDDTPWGRGVNGRVEIWVR